MIISEINKDSLRFAVHETRKEAVAYVLDALGPDYTSGPNARFWSSAEGLELMQSTHGMLDFGCRIYNSTGEALISLADYDDEAMPMALRALADAIEAAA